MHTNMYTCWPGICWDVSSARRIRADALIVATGLVAGCQAIVSNDDVWQRRLAQQYPLINFLYLDALR